MSINITNLNVTLEEIVTEMKDNFFTYFKFDFKMTKPYFEEIYPSIFEDYNSLFTFNLQRISNEIK